MNVVNTQLPQLYYNYNECFSLFSTYCILQCKNLGGGHNKHVVIWGGARAPGVSLVPPPLFECIEVFQREQVSTEVSIQQIYVDLV